MIETPAAAAPRDEIALEADFLSIGTNDLVATTLGLDRELPLASASDAADPAVLAHVASVVACRARGRDHRRGLRRGRRRCRSSSPLFVGLGVDELSVAPARIDAVRERRPGALSRARRGRSRARRSLAPSADAVLELVRSGEVGDELREALDGLGGVRRLRPR